MGYLLKDLNAPSYKYYISRFTVAHIDCSGSFKV